MRRLISGAAALTLVATSSAASADPIDNPGATIIDFTPAPIPFLKFASGDGVGAGSGSVMGTTVSNGTFTFLADIKTGGATAYTYGGDVVSAYLNITDLQGSIILSGAQPYVDWDITAYVSFQAGTTTTEANCYTSSFTIHVDGDPDLVSSDPFTIPALATGTTCGSAFRKMGISNRFDLGQPGASITLYKTEFWAVINGQTYPLQGS